jgi:hypothetical protein
MAHGLLGGDEHAGDVDGDHGLVVLERYLPDRPAQGDAGVVHQDVRAAEGVDRPGDGGAHGLWLARVGQHRQGTAAGRFDGGGGFLGQRGRAGIGEGKATFAPSAAIGGSFDLSPGVVARTLAPAHIVAVAAPVSLARHAPPVDPSGLATLDGIVMRSLSSGRVRTWSMCNAQGDEAVAAMREAIVVNDPAALREAARPGLGVALLAVPDVLPWLESGELVRVLPRWWADAGAISLCYASRSLPPGKTRAFLDFVIEAFARENYARRFAGSLG